MPLHRHTPSLVLPDNPSPEAIEYAAARFRAASAAMNLEAFIGVLLAGLTLEAFAMVLGVHIALRTPNTRLAIGNTLGTVFFLSVGTLICIYLILINGRFEYQWFSFIFFLGAGIGGLWWVLSSDRPSKVCRPTV